MEMWGLRCASHNRPVPFYATHRRLRTRSLKTIFGAVEINRIGYSRDGAPSIYPLDQTLALPARSFSYELQRRWVKTAVQNPSTNRSRPAPTLPAFLSPSAAWRKF